jgi:septal ring-binding cell division protein DamX
VNINYKQPQFELFPGSSGVGDDVSKPRFFLANLTLTIENLVVLSILGIMLAVFAYSLGVERGKHVMAVQMTDRALAKSVVADVSGVIVKSTAVVSATQPAGTAVAAAPAQAVRTAPAVVVEQKLQNVNPAFKYTVQVASYADEKFAQRAAQDLGKKGFETIVMQKGKYAILCVGKFNQMNEAKAAIAKLKSKYKDCLVRSM